MQDDQLNGTVSFVIPVLNEEKRVTRCLDSIGKQTYPHDCIEIIIADANSTDRTLPLIETWRKDNDIALKIVTNDKTVAEFGKALALKETEGDFVCVLDCDEEIVQEDAVETYVKAFDIFPDIVGVEQHFLKTPGGYPLNNYFALIQLTDPLAWDISGKLKFLEKTVVDSKTYRKFVFPPTYPALLFLKREFAQKYIAAETWEEGQVMMDLARNENNVIARIDGYGVRHHHIASFRQFLQKRRKIALKHITRTQQRETWVTYARSTTFFAFLHLTFIYPLIYSCFMAVKSRDAFWLYHAPLCFAGSLTYAVSWLYIKMSGKKAW